MENYKCKSLSLFPIECFSFVLNCSLEKYRFCSMHHNLDNRKNMESTIFIDFLWYSILYFSTSISLISSIRVVIESLTFSEEESIETTIFLSFDHNPDRQNFQEMFNSINLARFSNSSFSVTTSMISPTKISIKNSPSALEDLFHKPFVPIHASDSWQSKFSQKVLFSLFSFDVQTFLSQ